MSSYVSVPVREEHVPQVYALLAKLEQSTGGEGGDALAEPGPADNRASRDEALVRRMYRESQGTHQALLEHLAEQADQWVPSSALLKVAHLPESRKGLAGTFGAFGRRSKHRYDRARPWDFEWDAAQHEARYRMPADVAVWIKEEAT